MTYAAAISIILLSGIVAAFITALLHRLIEFDLRRHHHDAGSVVFLQLGVVIAVLLAFVFNEVWSEYNEAAKAIDLEISAMHGVAIIAATLEPAQAKTFLVAEKAYLEAAVHREWPMMAQNRKRDLETTHRFVVLLQDAARLRLTEQQDTKAEILSLLAQAHAHRETRIFQAKNSPAVVGADRLHGHAVTIGIALRDQLQDDSCRHGCLLHGWHREYPRRRPAS